ncbi:MAG: hypothetical protein H6793_02115 [Candidatus Nomurabacteria bacterium]|nr:hypothetical protein [Candidatus Saccharibacteria bacterium]USN95938.1 MAG: hypothetical protein H6793_02115 [Candidatus Nomurabacteria bacterium]
MQDQNDEDKINLEDDIEDIELQENNELLDDQDSLSSEPIESKDNIEDNTPNSGNKITRLIKDLWRNPKKRWGIIIGSAVIVMVVAILPQSRYFVLNNVGVRSSASIKVLDSSTGQPLKNVSVKIGSVESKTGQEGVAKLDNLKLGNTKLIIHKRAFAESTSDITIGWGSNPLGEQNVKPVGLQYTFDIKDYLSGKPIEKAEAVSGEYSAFSDENGKAVLTIDQPGEDTIKITINADGRRSEEINQQTESKEAQEILMVPARKHIFVSKRSGKYDVYKVDLDGKNEELLLSGTGYETDDISLVPNADKDMTALVSTRENTRNKDGFLLSTLTLIDATGDTVSTEPITKSEKIQVIGWSGDQLVYVKIADGASASTPGRHRLITYNSDTGQSKEIAQSNYFNDLLMIGDDIYYAPSSAFEGSKKGFFKVNSKGEDQRVLFDNEVWNIIRTDYDTLMFSVDKDWYEYDLTSGKVLASNGPPVSQITRVYIDGPEKKKSLWIDQRDGKGTLLTYDTNSKEDKVIKTQSGLTYPILWLSDKVAIYRISTDQESADYAISLDGGEAKKIRDVTKTSGIDRWYYYR